MKVAILTQPLHTNFGGTLQAYALQKTLKNLGHNPVTINMRRKSDCRSSLRNFLAVIKQRLTSSEIRYNFTFDELKKVGVNHSRFIERNIVLSSPFYSGEEVSDFISTSGFDAIVVGSDQVWRPRYSPRIATYFLDFLSGNKNITKLSYAASFGTDDWEFSEQQTASFRMLTKEFDAVSVRESSAVSMCKENLFIDAVHVLDPTLLIPKSDYLQLFNVQCSSPKGGLFTYVLDRSNDKNLIIDSVCSALSLNQFSTQPKITKKDKFLVFNYEDYIYPDIEEWIKSFYDAEFVVTDSFHGTVFSIIFNKPFIAIANEVRGRARFMSLLSLFGLENRLVNNVSDMTNVDIKEPIDYDSINDKLDELRNQSVDFIRNNLKD